MGVAIPRLRRHHQDFSAVFGAEFGDLHFPRLELLQGMLVGLLGEMRPSLADVYHAVAVVLVDVFANPFGLLVSVSFLPEDEMPLAVEGQEEKHFGVGLVLEQDCLRLFMDGLREILEGLQRVRWVPIGGGNRHLGLFHRRKDGRIVGVVQGGQSRPNLTGRQCF